ncbi:MAG: hypothetical protein HYV26_17580 [Candidatus Hydrogenedentes bacterium]|nr:hypothetical protein [Candidatus Hydrogenedentota bacterium]
MKNWMLARAPLAAGILTLIASLALLGCPTSDQGQYDLGFVAGFAEDGEYWQGYADSWDTRDGGTIYYTGDEIPFLDEVSYDAGYWDGVWYAYNDGYFVAYDYAFTIGFSEGYDLAYYPDYLDFLASDQHIEWLDGGFSDGYNDGFSEGRILGATDYRDGLAYDWFGAMEWYREGNDAYIEELDLGTGDLGPVELYVYGTNPDDVIKGTKSAVKRPAAERPTPSIRRATTAKAEEPELSYRSLTSEVESELNVSPSKSPRVEARSIALETTWLARIEQYMNTLQ